MSKPGLCTHYFIFFAIFLSILLAGCSNVNEVSEQVKLQQEMREEKADTQTINQEVDVPIYLYFIRHGESILNALGRVQGWSDSTLTKEGMDEAEDIGAGLADIKFDFVYSSDMIRAASTAKIIMDANTASEQLEIHKVFGLRETNFGKYEGETNEVMWGEALKRLGVSSFEELSNIEDGNKKVFDAVAVNDETGKAETYEEAFSRLMEAVDTIVEEVKKDGGGNVLVVGHGGTIGKINQSYNNTPLREVTTIPNASVMMLEYKDGNYIVHTVADESYKKKGAMIRQEKENEVVIYLTRHGKTIFNTMDRVQGWVDSSLTEAGIEVAKNLGKGLSDIKFSSIYTSDMGRTVETAQIVLNENIQSKELTIHEISGLRETNYGKYEGGFNTDMVNVAISHYGLNSREELMNMDQSTKKVLDVLHDTDETGMAENYSQMSTRVNNAFEEVCREASLNGGGNILVVSHGNAIMAILNQLGTKNITEITNASVTKIRYKSNHYTVETVNDMSFVEKGARK